MANLLLRRLIPSRLGVKLWQFQAMRIKNEKTAIDSSTRQLVI